MNADIRQFLRLLFGEKPEELWIYLWQSRGNLSHWFRDIEEAAARAEQLAEDNLYLGLSLSATNNGDHRRCTKAETAGITALWLDLDVKGPAHQKVTLPVSTRAALALLPPEFPASLIINSGHGLQAYWLLKEPCIFSDDAERERVAAILERWDRFIRYTATAHNVSIDAVFDLSRIFRVPGTMNLKDGCPPVRASIMEANDRRYTLFEIDDFLDDFPLLKAAAKAPRTTAPVEYTAQDFALRADARLDPALVAVMLENNERFRALWTRTRAMVSQSEYDLALANIGLDMEMPTQQIVDMLIEHRRDSNKPPKYTRPDYYTRTLARAHERALAAPQLDDAPKETPKEKEPGARPNPATAGRDAALLRSANCEWLAKALGLPIVRILKFTSKQPTWVIELSGGRVITVASIEQLDSYTNFRRAAGAQLNLTLNYVKPAEWIAKVYPTILKAIEERDPGAESTEAGFMRAALHRYLSSTGVVQITQLRADDRGDSSPFIHNERIAVHMLDLREFMNRTWGERPSRSEIVSMFHAIGAVNESIPVSKPGGRARLQGRWILPPEFAPEDYAVTLSGDRVTAEERGPQWVS